MNNRKSNFELLRIVSMLLIVTYHMRAQGIYNFDLLPVHTQIFLNTFGLWGRVGVNLFLIIGCYFMAGQDFRMSKILVLWGELYIYSVIFSLITLAHTKELSLKLIEHAFFPFLSGQCWFITIYIILMIFAPFLNYLLTMEENQLTRLIICGGGVLTGFSTITPRLMDNTITNISWFIFVYIFIGWYKRYGKNIKISLLSELLLLTTIAGVFIILPTVKCLIHSPFLIALNKWGGQWQNDFKSLPNFMLSVLIFRFFERMDMGINKYINFISSGTSDVYIIHQIHGFEMIIWNDIFQITNWCNKNNAVLFFVMTVIIIFIAASLIGCIRRKTFEKLFIRSRLYNFLNAAGNELIIGSGVIDTKIFDFRRIFKNS